MNRTHHQTLDVVQQTLKGLLLALLAQPAIDRSALAMALTKVAQTPPFDPAAVRILSDLAQGAAMFAPGKSGPH